MPSSEVINLTLSDDEIQPDPIRSDQGTTTPTQATNRFRTSSSTPPTSGINRTRRILPVIQGTFAAIERAKNYLPLQPFFNNTHFGQTLINCIHNLHRIGIPDEYFVETCINTYTQNSFVTKEFVKIDKDSQTQDYTIILTEVWILQGIYPLKDEWVFGCSLKTRLADQTKTQQLKWLWSNDTKDSTIIQRLVEQTQEETLSWKVVEVLPWMTP